MKHFKSLQEEDDSLSSEVVRRSALIQDVLQLIQLAESRISQAISLRSKFLQNVIKVQKEAQEDDQAAVGDQMKQFVKDLLCKQEVQAIGASRGPVGQLVLQMFNDAFKASQMILDDLDVPKNPFPKPFSRQFVLKVSAPRPYAYSQPSPQRLYCQLKQHEFRLAAAFSIDQQFM